MSLAVLVRGLRAHGHMTPRRTSSEAGFSLIEVLITGTIVATLLAAAALVMPGVLTMAKADSGSAQLTTLLRTAREQAITERRNIEIRFIAPDRAEAWREEIDDNGTQTGETLVQEVFLGERMELRRFPELPDTPDGFGPGVLPVAFTGSSPWCFTSEGTLVDANGDVVNGTLFLAQPFVITSARAITIFGPTALLREWQWDGRAWSE